MIDDKPRVRAATGLLYCLIFVPLMLAETTSIRVDGNVIKSYIAQMSGGEQLGRKSLTPGYERVADWAAAQFKEWGLKPAGDNGTFFQSVPLKGDRASFAWAAGVPELSINGRTFYLKDNDFSVDASSTPGARVNAEIVFVGYGISAPGKGLDEYSVDVKSKIVLALKGSPQDAPAVRGMGMGPGPQVPQAEKKEEDPWKDEIDDMRKARAAYEKGAAGILLYNPGPPPAPGQPQARREVEASPFTRPFIYVSNVDERAFRWIMSRDPQESVRGFGVRMDQVRRDIKEKKVRSAATGAKALLKGYDAVTLYGEKFKNNVSRNVLAKIEGTDPELKNQYVIAGGHLDHLGVTNGIVFNGADDNASGSAVAMEVGRLLALHKVQPRRTLIFALWCGEEMGLLGSRHYTATPSDGVSMDRVVGYFNMDMVGLGTEIGAPGALNFPEIFNAIMRDQDPEVAKIVRARTGGPGGSDHSGFIELGIEALALMTSGGGGHPDYHNAEDDPDKMQPDILGKTGQFVLQGMLNLANEASVNLIIPDRLHTYNAMRWTIPDITGGSGGWEHLKADSSAQLIALANERAKELKRPAAAPPAGPMGFRGQAGPRVTRGVKDADLFAGSVPLMEAEATLLDFGRVDVRKDNGPWFDNGVTHDGLAAIKAMEANNIVLNLVDPSSKLLRDVLDAATKPFMVTLTGAAALDPALVSQMNRKDVLMAVECKPADVQGCASRLEDARKQFGDFDNLLLSMNASGDIDEARKSLYMTLIRGGWTKDQIYVMTGGAAAGGRPGGNLARLAPRP